MVLEGHNVMEVASPEGLKKVLIGIRLLHNAATDINGKAK